ncbi:alpha/beta fold hydrolase [Jatrophihabitans sp. YIM 134969]
MVSFRQPGTVVTNHRLSVPLRPTEPDGEQIELFVREVVADEPGAERRPPLLFLQGGPGCAANRPVGRESWLEVALRDHRVLLMDQRGTGLSTPANRRTLVARGSAAEQAEYLTWFRADSIVADSEQVRQQLLHGAPMRLLGQSFGGFCVLTYLSQAPDGIEQAYVTGGLAGLTATADDVYRVTYPLAAERSRRHYANYPGDVEVVQRLVAELLERPARLPGGGLLTAEAFQSLGHPFGTRDGSHHLHYLLETALPDAHGPSDAFLAAVEEQTRLTDRPLYAVVHESCYAQGGPTAWSAQRVRGEFPEFDAAAAVTEGRPVMFTGEMTYPWMFDVDPALTPLREVADLLAAKDDWPALYDVDRLRANTVPVAAAVYSDDLYVPLALSEPTAATVGALDAWITPDHQHDALRVSDGAVLEELIVRSGVRG